MKRPTKRGPGRPRKDDPVSKEHVATVALSATGIQRIEEVAGEADISRSKAMRLLIEKALDDLDEEGAGGKKKREDAIRRLVER